MSYFEMQPFEPISFQYLPCNIIWLALIIVRHVVIMCRLTVTESELPNFFERFIPS
jgi:hypothetical protein